MPTAASLMAESPKLDPWDVASSAYATKTEHVTRPGAEALISWLDDLSPLSHANAFALDNGPGTGVVTASLRSRFPHLPIVAADLSPGMLEHIEKKQLPQVQCKVVDANDLHPIATDTFTHSLSTFMIQFSSDPRIALQEMYRVTTPNGTLGLCMWGEIAAAAPWVETARLFDPDYVYPHTWTPDWGDQHTLPRYVADAGFKDVKLRTVRARWDFPSPEEVFQFYFESKNPEFIRGYQPWWDRGMEGTMRPIFEKIVRERYGGGKEFDAEAFLIVATK